MNGNHLVHSSQGTEVNWTTDVLPQLLLAFPFLLALGFYIAAVILSNRHLKTWPLYRTICWSIGCLSAIVAVAGPLAELAHMNFTVHMLGHLLLGMLAPLLMVVAAPMTLLLRTISTPTARKLTRLLKSWPSRLVTHPVVAAFLNLGGLWLLYTTDLYAMMHQNILLHLIIHMHVFAAGYVFTVSMIYIDPVAHRFSFLYRSVVLIVFLAGHGILSKFIYAHPPTGVSVDQAQLGGKVMYYGGDAIDIVLIFILCLHWYRASRPRYKTKVSY